MEDRTVRAKARAEWQVRRYPLAKQPSADLSATSTARERLAMMWPLAVEAWTLAKGPQTPLPRSRWPVRRVKLGASPG